MRNIPINEAESIFEPFWDSGESYPDHQKYSVLSGYDITISPMAIATVLPTWCSVDIAVQRNGNSLQPAVVLERACQLDAAGYDVIRLFAAIPPSMRVVLICSTEKQGSRVALDQWGGGETREYDGPLEGERITRLRLEVYSLSSEPATLSLLWLGLSNRCRQLEMEQRPSPYTAEWEGCFADTYELKPAIGIYFHDGELEELRSKLRHSPFDRMMEKLRRQARQDLSIVPEAQIGEYLPRNSRRWERDRDMKKHKLDEAMERLAYVGLIDGNEEMLRMACRMALSAAHHTHWCESVMGAFPGVTWHHRSFAEEAASRACSLVLDWAGGLLTWHGRHIILDAIITKGLPRIEADFKTVEYIRRMNQGIVFSGGRMITLLALCSEYPRYSLWLNEAERDLHEMVSAYIQADGGTLEGPGYWNYTMANVLPVMSVLARSRGQSLAQYVPDCIRRSEEYALAMLSAAGDERLTVAVGDGHARPYDAIVVACYAMLSDKPEWKRLYSRIIREEGGSPASKELLMLADLPSGLSGEGHILEPGLRQLPVTGQTSLVADVDGIGRIKLHACSGPTFFAHYHEDKGSLVLEAAGEALLVERGMCDYSHPYGKAISKADVHNLLFPESEGSMHVQPKHAAGGRVAHASLEEDGVFLYTTELAGAWEEGLYKRNYRRIFAPSPCLYLVHDEVEYGGELASSFRLNTRGSIVQTASGFMIQGKAAWLSVACVNWQPEQVWHGAYGYDEHMHPVSQLRLYTGRSRSHSLVTAIEVLPPGDNGNLCRIVEAAAGSKPLLHRGKAVEIIPCTAGLRVRYGGRGYTAHNEHWTKEDTTC
ncbi:MAG: hypothetical protein K0R57_3049 [Paenibacillaceae bacterium]|nr:hypothetical protein [Paenibacillaceae bacterium]